MRPSVRLLLVAFILFLGTHILPTPTPVQAQSGRQVYAYYFGWYSSDSWNAGNLVDRPAAPYNSADASVISRQIGEAQSAGIDAFVMSWFGPKNNNLTNIVFNMLLDQAAAHGFQAGASVDMFEGGYNATTGEVLDSLRYLIGDRVNHPAYLRYNGKPVIYFWNQNRFSRAQWADMRAQVDPNHNTIWVMEGTNTGYLGVFDGLYLFNTAWSSSPASTARSWQSRTFGAGGTFYTPTVMPGWDESRIGGRTNPTSPQARSGGAFLRNSWLGAASSGSNAILIVSWNEYLENSYVEPSQNLGTQALDTLRPLIAAWKGGRAAPASSSNSATAAAGTTFTARFDTVNVRSGAGSQFPVIGTIHYGDSFTIKSRSNGWYEFDFNGQTGYVSAQLVKVS